MCIKTTKVIIFLFFASTISIAGTLNNINSDYFTTISNLDTETLKNQTTNIDNINTFEKSTPNDGIEASNTTLEETRKLNSYMKAESSSQKDRVFAKKAKVFYKDKESKSLANLIAIQNIQISSQNTTNKAQINNLELELLKQMRIKEKE